MVHSTEVEVPVTYQLEAGAGPPVPPAGRSARAGLAGFLRFVRRAGAARALRERVRLPLKGLAVRREGRVPLGERLAGQPGSCLTRLVARPA